MTEYEEKINSEKSVYFNRGSKTDFTTNEDLSKYSTKNNSKLWKKILAFGALTLLGLSGMITGYTPANNSSPYEFTGKFEGLEKTFESGYADAKIDVNGKNLSCLVKTKEDAYKLKTDSTYIFRMAPGGKASYEPTLLDATPTKK